MNDFLQSGRRKIARANAHIGDLKTRESGFFADKPYRFVTEPDPECPENIVHKLKFIKGIDSVFEDIVADAAFNLRAALDHACYAIAIAYGKVEPKSAYFPIAQSDANGLDKVISGRCKDLPWEISDFIRALKPYPGGNNLLAALNELCNTHKHAFAVPAAAVAGMVGVSVNGTGYFSVPRPHIWDSAKNEMEIITLGPGAVYDNKFSFIFTITFGEIKIISGQPVVSALSQLAGEVERILVALEAEAIRIGLFK